MAELQNNQPDSGREILLLDYLIVVVKHSRMIIFTSIAAMLLTYLVLLILPNKYTSLARLLTPQQNRTMSAQLLNSLGGGGCCACRLLTLAQGLYIVRLERLERPH